MMVYNPYFAIVYAYDGDGEFEASMPCFTEEDVMKKASRYDNKVRVVRTGLPPFWLKINEQERSKYVPSPAVVNDAVAKKTFGEGVYYKDRKPFVGERFDGFYDGWGGHKKSKLY